MSEEQVLRCHHCDSSEGDSLTQIQNAVFHLDDSECASYAARRIVELKVEINQFKERAEAAERLAGMQAEELGRLKNALDVSEGARQMYQDGTLKLYAMGEPFVSAAMKVMPSGSGALDRYTRQMFLYPAVTHRDKKIKRWQRLGKRLLAEREQLRGVIEMQADQLKALEAHNQIDAQQREADRARIAELEAIIEKHKDWIEYLDRGKGR